MLPKTSPIPLLEPWLPPACADAVCQQILSGMLGPGATTQAFAQQLAESVGVPHCVPTVSGTVALSVAARALGLQPGDEILVPAYGVISTIHGFASIGLRPRLVDIDPDTGCMDPARLEGAITGTTRAVCFVNFSGYTGANLEEVAAICACRGVPLIEDAACALGQRYGARAAGSFGTASILSFSVPKVVTTGQGGAVLTNDIGIFQRASAWIDQGDLAWRKTNLNREVGTNLRFNDILARFGLVQLQSLPDRLRKRRETFEALRERLREHLFDVPGEAAPLHTIVFSAQPDALVQRMKTVGIAAVRQYRTIAQHPCYADLALEAYPGADYWTDHAVYLPFGLALSPADGRRIGDAAVATGLLTPWRQRRCA